MRIKILFFGVTLVLFACQPASMHNSSSQSQNLSFITKTITEKTGDCETQDAPCMKVTLECLFADQGPEELVSFVNQSLLTYYLESFGPVDEKDTSLNNLAKAAIKDYEDLLKEMPEYSITWEIDQNSKLLFQNDKVVSIQINNSSYLGGAHPNYYESHINIDLEEKEVLTKDNMFQDTTKLKEIAQKAFKKERELEETANLQEEGFFWDEDFYLPKNITLTKEGLLFTYNPYEAAAYAQGMTVFTIPYVELKGILKEEYDLSTVSK